MFCSLLPLLFIPSVVKNCPNRDLKGSPSTLLKLENALLSSISNIYLYHRIVGDGDDTDFDDHDHISGNDIN